MRPATSDSRRQGPDGAGQCEAKRRARLRSERSAADSGEDGAADSGEDGAADSGEDGAADSGEDGAADSGEGEDRWPGAVPVRAPCASDARVTPNSRAACSSESSRNEHSLTTSPVKTAQTRGAERTRRSHRREPCAVAERLRGGADLGPPAVSDFGSTSDTLAPSIVQPIRTGP